MTQRTWVIVGATSIIAEKFAHLAAREGNNLLLIGRQEEPLSLIANDIQLRYHISCDIFMVDLNKPIDNLLALLQSDQRELDLFIAHSDFTDNTHLTQQTITQLVQTNILSTTLLINTYINKNQTEHHLLYLSSVAACRGRTKNSLYGASKACIEIYLQGLQQAATNNQHMTIARLGFIDTKQTYGLPGIFYAGPPESCAMACWKAIKRKKRMVYYPAFWWGIMAIITRIPFFVYKKMGSV